MQQKAKLLKVKENINACYETPKIQHKAKTPLAYLCDIYKGSCRNMSPQHLLKLVYQRR